MAERTIVGVDFSGAQADNATWITEARLDVEKLQLDVLECYSIKREALTEKLADGKFAVAGVDFPFSLPQRFANELQGEARTMRQIWEAIVEREMSFEEFENKRNHYVKSAAGGKLHLRAGDIYWPKALSCLQTGGPNMLPMTFYGMRMLQTLWKAGCGVPPIHDAEQKERILLETMPGTALGVWSLHNTLYKNGLGVENRRQRRERRKDILAGLKDREKVGLHLHISEYLERKCIDNIGGDALDSLVAAIVAAKWRIKPSEFRHPGDGITDGNSNPKKRLNRLSFHVDNLNDLQAKEPDLAKLEGWIYAPKK